MNYSDVNDTDPRTQRKGRVLQKTWCWVLQKIWC